MKIIFVNLNKIIYFLVKNDKIKELYENDLTYLP